MNNSVRRSVLVPATGSGVERCRSSQRKGAVAGLLLSIALLPGASWSQERISPAPAATASPTATPALGSARSAAPCETCGTVIAINRVVVEGTSPPLAALPQRVLERATAEGTTVSRTPAAGGPKQRYEVVVRLSAGTQQVVMLDDPGKLVVGQRVRIDNGAVLPERG
jgi:hypothetical protein